MLNPWANWRKAREAQEKRLEESEKAIAALTREVAHLRADVRELERALGLEETTQMVSAEELKKAIAAREKTE